VPFERHKILSILTAAAVTSDIARVEENKEFL